MNELKTTAAQRKAVREYEKNNYRLNIVFPKGTKERIEALKLDKTNSAFIRDTILNKLDELEKEVVAERSGLSVEGGSVQVCRAVEELETIGKAKALASLVIDNVISKEEAAERAGMSIEEFEKFLTAAKA